LHFERRDADNPVCVILAVLSLISGFSRVYLAATMLEPLQRFLYGGKPLKRLEDLTGRLPPR
jgi:hypothetical protein